MRYPRRVQRQISEIERRFQGRAQLIVEYPNGHSTTLGEALVAFKAGQWKG